MPSVARLLVRRVVHEVLEHAQAAAGGGRGGLELPQRPHREGGRLLERDVLARREGGEGDVAVEVVREEDVDGVDVGRAEELLVIGERLGRAPLGATPLGERRIAVAHGDQGRAGMGEIARGVEGGDPPAPDDPHPQPRGGARARWDAGGRHRLGGS
jgi:hypothetical protein